MVPSVRFFFRYWRTSKALCRNASGLQRARKHHEEKEVNMRYVCMPDEEAVSVKLTSRRIGLNRRKRCNAGHCQLVYSRPIEVLRSKHSKYTYLFCCSIHRSNSRNL